MRNAGRRRTRDASPVDAQAGNSGKSRREIASDKDSAGPRRSGPPAIRSKTEEDCARAEDQAITTINRLQDAQGGQPVASLEESAHMPMLMTKLRRDAPIIP